MARSSLDLDLARLSLGATSPFQHAASSATSPAGPHSSQSQVPYPQSQQQQQQLGGALQPHQVMQPPVHSGPPPHVQLQEPQRRRGVVKFFNSLKGFGFVVDNDPAALGGQEVFCHFSAISGKGGFRSLGEGEEVEYELVQGPKGFQAANLTGPGGRTVQGDPKARLQQKPPPYMPFPPLAMPLGGPYLADPYHAQHAGVYAGSPYTQHVVYVPATAALPPSQYAYAPVPLAAPRHHQSASSQAGGASTSSASPFTAPQYQSYAAPPSNVGTQGSPNPNVAGSTNQSTGYQSASGQQHQQQQHQQQQQGGNASRFGAATGAYGAPQPPMQDQRHPAQNNSASFNPAFSPPGGNYAGLADSPAGGSNGPTFGFAPFSPPSFHHAPLFGVPPPPPSGPHALSQQLYPQQPQNQYSSRHASSTHTTSPPQSSSGIPAVSQSALFGTSSSPAPIGTGSRSGTPSGATGGRSTPLGNGSIGNDAWKVTPPKPANTPGTSGVLYASQSNGVDN
ncbi:uncharacterized protein JCM15063_003604 [Sporobolomyces koalae]|uniref:uncharacterized protein n=1 Tax=Sporobolomyces koalae TaxID=500713 RepID=UPI003182816C